MLVFFSLSLRWRWVVELLRHWFAFGLNCTSLTAVVVVIVVVMIRVDDGIILVS